MFYRKAIEIPANTPISSPEEERIVLGYGILHQVEVTFPRGCAGLTHIQIHHRKHILFPTSVDEWFAADGYTIKFKDYFPITSLPYEVKVLGYNEDDTYSHTPIIRIGILPEAEATLAQYMKGFFAAPVEEQIPVETLEEG